MSLTATQIKEIRQFARQLGVELAALVAIVEVESAGKIFARVNGLDVPVIRWEGHYFYRLTKNGIRDRAVKEGLASPQAGAIGNPSSQAARYDMLSRAAMVDAAAAYQSISIGVGQVMGVHYASLGFESPEAMFQRAAEGLAGQVDLMIRFIDKNELVDEIRRKDWSAFARAYNGPAYARNGYHTKMEAAYRRALGRIAGSHTDGMDAGSASGMLRLGSKGAGVREVQRLLVRAGYPLKVDGDFGPATKEAVKVFQAENALDVDGVVGPETYSRLIELRGAPDEDLSKQALLDLPEAAPAAVGAGGGLGVAVAADKLSEVASRIGGSEALDAVASGLYAASGVLIVAGLLWGAWGYLKARRTYEGVA